LNTTLSTNDGVGGVEDVVDDVVGAIVDVVDVVSAALVFVGAR